MTYRYLILFCLSVLALSKPQVLPSLHLAKHYAMDLDFEIFEIEEDLKEFILQDPTVVGTATFLDDRNATGWTYLYVNTSNNTPDYLQGYATGKFEGQLAYEFVYDSYLNEEPMRVGTTDKVMNFIAEQNAWIEKQIESSDPYWQLVKTAWYQQKGIYDGYIAGIAQHLRPDLYLSEEQLYLVTYFNDLSDVISLYSDGDSGHVSYPHCSFLLRLADDDLYGAQTTWDLYGIMLKTYKVFNNSFTNPLVQNNIVSYSSQPGQLSSGDDFYVMNNNRYVAETSLQSYNNSVYGYLHTDSLPYWIRVTIANWAFDTQETWANIFFSNRSGTYNNQWLVVDYNQYNTYKDNMEEAENVIWLIEEFYYLTSSQDVTQTLLVPQGYVGSYNAPYSPAIAAIAEYPTTYTNDPRAILFAKYSPNIQTFEEFQFVMRLNNISDTGDYCQAIACRCDLNTTFDQPFGSLDCKTTSASMIANLQTSIQVGPTTELGIEIFTWDNWPNYQNLSYGQPRTFDFPWVLMDPYNTA